MTAGRWAEIKAVVATALDTPTANRRAYLDDACGTDAELRREVESLLVAAQGPDSLPAARAAVAAASASYAIEAESILRRQLAVLDEQKALGKVVGDHDAITSDVRVQLGMALADRGRRSEAEALLAESVPKLPARHADTKRAVQFMVRFYEDWERFAPSQGHGARAALWRGRLSGESRAQAGT